jgi:hypothetical protein
MVTTVKNKECSHDKWEHFLTTDVTHGDNIPVAVYYCTKCNLTDVIFLNPIQNEPSRVKN